MASFWVARIARLWPLHLTMLAVIALFAPPSSANTALAFIAHIFMLQAFVTPVAGTFDWSSWSLTIEVFCYAIFCMANAHGRRVLLWVTGLLIVVCLLAVIFISQPGGPYAGGVFRRGLLGFFVGQAMWHARGHLKNLPIPLLVLGMVEGFWFQVGPYASSFTMTMLAWPCFLLLTMKLKAMEARPMVWLGDRSYAIYLINLPLVQAVARMMSGATFTTGQVVLVQAGIVATVLLAADFSYRWIETPSRKAIRRAWVRRQDDESRGGALLG
jgi:peptidoglycan/LPS O-acetylase OafA/YrhL